MRGAGAAHGPALMLLSTDIWVSALIRRAELKKNEIEALAEELLDSGHEVRVLAPFDPPDALSARLHRGARPAAREVPDYLAPLGRTVGFHANGAVSNVSVFPEGVFRLRTELARGNCARPFGRHPAAAFAPVKVFGADRPRLRVRQLREIAKVDAQTVEFPSQLPLPSNVRICQLRSHSLK